MKVRFFLAFILLSAGQCFAQYGMYIGVQEASVSGWNGCKGTLTVILNQVASPTSQYPIDLQTGIGYTCPPGMQQPYGYGCYTDLARPVPSALATLDDSACSGSCF
jgi:hypothetical protein